MVYEPSRPSHSNSGITQLVELRPSKRNEPYLTNKTHILLKNQTESAATNNQTSYLILISRLNGYFEVINCFLPYSSPTHQSNSGNCNSCFQFQLVHLIRIYNTPITSLVSLGDYLIAISQESLFKIVKINSELFNSSQKSCPLFVRFLLLFFKS